MNGMRLAVTAMALLGVLLAPAPVRAQLPPAPEAIDRLGFLVGEWEGTGWMEYAPGQRAGFRGTERVERRMGGRLVVVEGDFTAWMGPERGDVPVHQALGIFSYDPRRDGIVFRTYTAHWPGGDAHGVQVEENRLVWGYEDPRFGTVRFTITVTPGGEWHEVGHASRDGGATWHPFMEMSLRRAAAP
jgi:hypothetical protein